MAQLRRSEAIGICAAAVERDHDGMSEARQCLAHDNLKRLLLIRRLKRVGQTRHRLDVLVAAGRRIGKSIDGRLNPTVDARRDVLEKCAVSLVHPRNLSRGSSFDPTATAPQSVGGSCELDTSSTLNGAGATSAATAPVRMGGGTGHVRVWRSHYGVKAALRW
jgi:hypothetical protein